MLSGRGLMTARLGRNQLVVTADDEPPRLGQHRFQPAATPISPAAWRSWPR